MISKNDIKAILTDSRSMALAPDVDHETQFVLDSFSLVALQSVLQEDYDIEFEPAWEELQELTSVTTIHEYLSRRYPDRVAS